MPDQPKILHVEDDPEIREIALVALEIIAGLPVVQCASGFEAIEVAPAVMPDIFLLDVMMPGMNGVETYQALRANPLFAATSVMFMTARAQPKEVTKLLDMGALDVVTKPFDPMTLGQHIIDVWTRKLSVTP